VQQRARRHGIAGIYGIVGMVESVTYKIQRVLSGSNPTLSASLSLPSSLVPRPIAPTLRFVVSCLTLAFLTCAACWTRSDDPSAAAKAGAPTAKASPRADAGGEGSRIIATDDGLQAPASLAAGLRHVILENRGNQIHEAMFIWLPKGMSVGDYVAAVRVGPPSRKGRVTIPDLG
jgi:hypothetical protein